MIGIDMETDSSIVRGPGSVFYFEILPDDPLGEAEWNRQRAAEMRQQAEIYSQKLEASSSIVRVIMKGRWQEKISEGEGMAIYHNNRADRFERLYEQRNQQPSD